MHPAPGSDDRPSYTSLVGSIDTSGVRYVSTMEVQTSRKEIIEGMESMCTVRLQAFLDEQMIDWGIVRTETIQRRNGKISQAYSVLSRSGI
jgi:hypothetical protein